MSPCPNIHGTAIVVGTRGLLFVGSSGSGKSALAFACLAAAEKQGAFAALVADDQVLISRSGDHIIASRPAFIAGMMELRGSGIVRMKSIASAVVDLVVEVVDLDKTDRLPPENEEFDVAGTGKLPLRRLWRRSPDPLASVAALMPAFSGQSPFRREIIRFST